VACVRQRVACGYNYLHSCEQDCWMIRGETEQFQGDVAGNRTSLYSLSRVLFSDMSSCHT
jgi:hypothetical protein